MFLEWTCFSTELVVDVDSRSSVRLDPSLDPKRCHLQIVYYSIGNPIVVALYIQVESTECRLVDQATLTKVGALIRPPLMQGSAIAVQFVPFPVQKTDGAMRGRAWPPITALPFSLLMID